MSDLANGIMVIAFQPPASGYTGLDELHYAAPSPRYGGSWIRAPPTASDSVTGPTTTSIVSPSDWLADHEQIFVARKTTAPFAALPCCQ
jgi:hypothetical protein